MSSNAPTSASITDRVAASLAAARNKDSGSSGTSGTVADNSYVSMKDPRIQGYGEWTAQAPGYRYIPGATQGGYSGIPYSPGLSGATAQTQGGLVASFYNNPYTHQTVMDAATVAYGYKPNMLQAAGLLNTFSEMWASNPSGPTPWGMVKGLLNGSFSLDDGSGGGGGGGYGGGGGGTTSQIRLTDPESAKLLINNAMAGLLGREATQEEYKAFLKTLNNEERNNPVVSTASGNTMTVTGGTNPQQIAKDYSESREDFAEFQAATTYMDAFMAALDDPVDI
jgi:hypothetical protein